MSAVQIYEDKVIYFVGIQDFIGRCIFGGKSMEEQMNFVSIPVLNKHNFGTMSVMYQ
jgi:hypothetical protein